MSGPQGERDELKRRITELRAQGVCYQCHDFEAGSIFGRQPVVYEDSRHKVVLDLFPRAPGHTIVVYKPHREDLSQLRPDETSALFQLCVRLMNAIKGGLGAEKVYLNTMCDGPINHLHVQLLPRYPGDPIGSGLFVAERGKLVDGDGTARRIGEALAEMGGSGKSGSE
jgi:diadenosine tetraphosphate (Ap4A) HIT family hydrolase